MNGDYKVEFGQRLVGLFQECLSIQTRLMGNPCSIRVDYSVGVFTRQSLSAYTLLCMCNAIPRPEILGIRNSSIHDFVSAFVVLRSMYEAVFVSNYILLSSDFDGARNAIVLVAELHAMREQLILAKNYNSVHPRAKQVEEDLPKIKSDIETHSEFECLPKFQKKYVRSPDLKSKKWFRKKRSELAAEAGFHFTQDIFYYKFFSNHTHADPLSIKQANEVRDPEGAMQFMPSICEYGVNFLSTALRIHRDVCQSEGMEVPISDGAIGIIDHWKWINAQDLSKDSG